MRKRDIVLKIAKDTNIIQSKIADVVQRILDYISDELAQGRNVELRNFGVFEIVIRKARKGRNPNKPEVEMIIPEKTVVKFKTGKDLKTKILKINPNSIK